MEESLTEPGDYFMPAEWAPHSRCWMAWPCNESLWANGIDRAWEAFARVLRAIAEYEPVSLLVRPDHLEQARRMCGSDIDYREYSLNDSWMRDFGPTFVVNRSGGIAGIDWRFNGWGKYPHDRDRHVARFVLAAEGIARLAVPLVLEGGAFHVDGEGSVLATAQSLLHMNRNPGLERDAVAEQLQASLGASRVIWLERGLTDDDTDGHVDELACFVEPGLVVALVSSDPSDPDYPVLQENLAVLRTTRDARGRLLDVVTIEQPEPAVHGGRRLTRSYVNFYLANGAVIMPAFGDAMRDRRARAILAELFPRRSVIQLPGHELAYGGGNIHCITQQQPDPTAFAGRSA